MRHNRARAALFRFCLLVFVILAAKTGTSPPLFVPSASSQEKSSSAKGGSTGPGIDVLEGENFAGLRGKRIGLITNQTGVDSQGRRTIDVLAHAEGVRLVRLFSPEHGIEGREDAAVGNARDAATGLPIYSLYGETRRPTDEMLKDLDALVFDIQDAGVRFYTYLTTMGYAMEEAAKRGIAFYVLDRPNPLGGEVIEGPALDRDRLSFTGYFQLPVRYAMTIGELARMFNAENKIGADLHVIPLKHWRRSQTYNETGLRWIPSSPNLRTLEEAFLYPGIEILQEGGASVGRGTDTPFEIVGAPWIRGADLAANLNRRAIPGVKFSAEIFTPNEGIYSGQYCQGVSIAITNRDSLRSTRLGLELADALHRMYPKKFHLDKIILLLGSRATVDALVQGESPTEIIRSWEAELEKFRAMREKYLLYDDGERQRNASSLTPPQ
jgi:uncharacterized protein YbbC (DUF1343 family)